MQSPFGGLHGAVVEADDDVLGVAWDVERHSAAIRALGEAVERSALLQGDGAQVAVAGRATDLGTDAADLSDCVRFSPEQLASHPELAQWSWTEQTVTSWTPVQTPRSGSVLLPIDLVLSMRVDPIRVRCASSIGTACGPDWEDALGRALRELVERHVVAVHVYRGAPAIEVLDHHADDVAGLRARLAANALQLQTGLLPNDFGFPVAIAAIRGDARATPGAAVGSGAGTSTDDAIRSAVLEAVHVFHLGWRLLRRGDCVALPLQTVNSRVLWWATEGHAFADDLFAQDGNGQALPAGSPISDDELGRRLLAAGHKWYSSDITPSWVRDATVARAVAPSLLQLRLDEDLPYMHGPRCADTIATFAARRETGHVVPHPYV